MIRSNAIIPILLLSFGVGPLQGQDASAPEGPSTQERYVTLSQAGDHAGLVELWRAEPESAVPVIDGDLEGSLSIWEDAGEGRRAEIDALVARAVAGAQAAVEATGRRRILDYVNSFAGWTDEQKLAFRGGQTACRAGSSALRDGDAETALGKGAECRSLAEPLGDWWGTAMGLRVEGGALAQGGDPEGAVTALSRGRLIFRELGLTSSALRMEVDLAGHLLDLGRDRRAAALIQDGNVTAERLGLGEIAQQFVELERRLGG
jgi:hypothetical protein